MQHRVQGLTGRWTVKWKGTWKFDLEDDNGIKWKIKIPTTLYCKEAPYCLLSPQHWSQKSDNPNGTYCKVSHEFMDLVWQNSNLRHKAKLNTNTNSVIIWSAPGYSKYYKFMAMSWTADNINSIRSDVERTSKIYQLRMEFQVWIQSHLSTLSLTQCQQKWANIRNHDNKIIKWHIRLNRLPFRKLKLMASMGMIPKKLSKIARIPICGSCVYGKATFRPWRNKQDHKPIKQAHIPGEYISIDSFESSTKGMVHKLRETLYGQDTLAPQSLWTTNQGYHTCT